MIGQLTKSIAKKKQTMALFALCENNQNFKYVALIQQLFGIALDLFLLVLGPCLICVVGTIVTAELYCFFEYLIPYYYEAWTIPWFLHSCFAIFVAINISFNYALCVSTNPGTHDSEVYKQLLKGAAESGQLKVDPRRRAGASNTIAGTVSRRAGREGEEEEVAPATSWIDQGDFEWGYCRRTKVRKAPRAHYDHITKKLVLNMDHYCPWMFNVVGYMNYRYFVNFLIYVLLTCFYGILITASPFIGFVRQQQERGVPFHFGKGYTRNAAVSYTFVLALSIGLGCSVGLLLGWHLYLIFTAQTTIEFYGNHTKAHRARLRGLRYQNPYDLGSISSNWKQVFGPQSVLIGLLPSSRAPPFPPWPQRSNQPDALQFGHIV